MTDRERAPDLLLAYLPHLDYVLQKFGPGVGDLLRRETAVLGDMLRQLVATAAEAGYRLVVWGDYAITAAERPVLLNRVLRQEGFFHVRRVGRRTYPDLYRSRAFAMVDHQIAHVFVSNAADLSAVRNCLAAVSGVDRVEPGAALIGHPESGDLVAVAAPGAWFAYPWWDAPREAPDYATHVDIHNKIGFDPCELFWGIPGLSISLDPGRVRGTHGRDDAPAALAAPAFDDPLPETTLELGARLRELLG
jgi:predicted AlkP superfamily pyrophosphatase or phosphodiesterase